MEKCMAYITEIWADMRLLGLGKQMEAQTQIDASPDPILPRNSHDVHLNSLARSHTEFFNEPYDVQ